MTNKISIRADLSDSTDVEVLRGTVSRFQRIFNGSGYGFWDWDLANQRIDWSGGFWERMGYVAEDEDELCDARNIVNYIHPEDREASRESLRQHLRNGHPYNTSYRVRTKSGDYIWTQVRADSIRDPEGRVLFMSGVSFDITALKEAEEALRESEARQERIIQRWHLGMVRQKRRFPFFQPLLGTDWL
jgi:PAS domain S-box-containing protein